MKFLKSKKGKLSTSVLNSAVLAIVLLVVLFQIYASVIPTAQTAGDSMNASNQCGSASCFYNASRAVHCTAHNLTVNDTTPCASPNVIPLSGLFSGQGVVFVIIMAALIILITKSFMKEGK